MGFLFWLLSLLLLRAGMCVCVLVCVVCFQVVNLDPVIEDDAELQKYSKVRRRGASVRVGGLSLTSYLSC